MMNAKDLARYIDEQGIAADIVYLTQETPTVLAAAAAVGARPEQIGKSLLFLADGQPLLVISNGLTRVNYKRLADYLAISRRRLKLANPEQVKNITGFPVGTVPPFGHLQPVTTILEADVLNQTELYAGGGAINALVYLTTIELQRVIAAPVVSL